MYCFVPLSFSEAASPVQAQSVLCALHRPSTASFINNYTTVYFRNTIILTVKGRSMFNLYILGPHVLLAH